MNLYTYCYSNPVQYVDSTGNIPIETILDIGSAIDSAWQVYKDPNLLNIGLLLWDIASLIPYVPGSYVIKGIRVAENVDNTLDIAVTISRTDKITDAIKAGDAVVEDIVDGTITAATKVDIPSTVEIHHFASNKNSKYTRQFEDILKPYGLDLNGDWNKAPMRHKGRHPNAYHEYILDQMKNIDLVAGGNKDIFVSLFDKVKDEVIAKPEMLRKAYWIGKN